MIPVVAGSFLSARADDEEFRLGRALDRGASFLELNLDEDEVRQVQEILGGMAVSYVPRYGAATLARKYPALTLVSLVGHAALAYDQGRYWESFWGELGIDRDQSFENTLRQELGWLLRRFGMREYPELKGSYSYIMVMAMHAGIPVHCLGDLIDVIEHHRLVGRERSGAAVFEWLTEPGMEYRLGQLDVPVRNFLQLGGDVAVDILGRIMDFIEFTADHSEVWNNLDLSTETTGLPTILLDGLIERLRERPIGGGNAVSSHSRRGVPVIGYSMADDQITVGVPYPATAPESPWRVSFGGDTRQVYAERGWGVDGDHPLTPVPVTRPVREVVLHHDGSGDQYRIAVVDTADPLLLFDIEGQLLPRRSALPRDVVLAVHPGDAQVVDAAGGGSVPSHEDVRSPSGWRGWRAHTIDLTDHDSIQLRRGGTALGLIREVRAVGAPTFETPDPLEGVTTTNGLSVYAQRPLVVLPKYRGTEPVEWRVRVRHAGRSDWLVTEDWESSSEQACLDPFDELPPGLLGHFEVVVSGPLGSDLRASLFLAEGLSVDHGVYFRAPVPGGLSPSVTRVECEPPLSVDRTMVAFDFDTREARIEVRSPRIESGGGGEDVDPVYRLVLTPPHVESRVDVVGTPAQWRTTAQVLTPADLEAHAVIAARVPGDVQADFALLDSTGAVVQSEIPDVPAEFVFQLSTRVFVDTARRIGSGRLVARVDDPAGESHVIVLAQIRPALLCGGADIEDGYLVFQDLADDELGVFVWATTAPWRPVRQFEIRGGRTELADELRDAGPLLVQVFVDDPWVSIPSPRRPDSSALRVDQPGWVHDDVPAREQLSRFLAGHGVVPRSSEAMAEVWAALAMLPSGRADTATEVLRGALVRVLACNPRKALEALGGSTIPAAEMVSLVIRTGLVDQSYQSGQLECDDSALYANPWVGCLIEIADLPASAASRAQDPYRWAQSLGYLENQGGRWLRELLRGSLGDPRIGVFDRNVERVHGFPPEQVDEIFEAFRLVPGALLDVDTRTSATVEAFHARSEWMQEPSRDVLTWATPSALGRIKQVAPLLYDTIRARSEVLEGVNEIAHPWMLLSLQSLTMAALARLDARKRFGIPPITSDMRAAWARMADLCPAMVATDLLIADALALYVTAGDLIGDSE